MIIQASAAVLEPGSDAQRKLTDALTADLVASLGVNPSAISITNIKEASNVTKGRRILQVAKEVQCDFVVSSPDVSAQDLLATLKQQLHNSTSALMNGSVSQLGYVIDPGQADALSLSFVCPRGKIKGGTGCQSCAQTPKAQFTADSIECKQCPTNRLVNAEGDGCMCADGFYDASAGSLVCYGLGESWDADDFAPTAAQDKNNPDAHCQPCHGQLEQCVSCDNGKAEIKAGVAASEVSKAGAAGAAPARGIVGPMALFVCPSNGCLEHNATGQEGDWLSPCERGYIGALCSACDATMNFIKNGVVCAECTDTGRCHLLCVAGDYCSSRNNHLLRGCHVQGQGPG